MERPMTTEINPVLDSVKGAFAPVTEAFKNFQNLEVPEAAREFVKKTANTAKARFARAFFFVACPHRSAQTLMVRRRVCAISNHEAAIGPSSFETRRRRRSSGRGSFFEKPA